MEQSLHKKAIDKFLKKLDSFESVEKKSIIAIYTMVIIYCTIQASFLCFYIIQQVPEMIFVNTTSILICFLTLYSLRDLQKLTLGLTLWILNACYNILAMTYILGYNKNSVAFLPILLLLIHFIFPRKKKYLVLNTAIVLITYCLNILIRYNVVSLYYDSFTQIELINSFSALTLAALIIYLKSKSDYLVEAFNSKEVENLNKKLEILKTEACVDFLTGLWNRRYIQTQIDLGDIDSNSYLILTDIDYFEQINAEFGNLCGDYILIEIAHILKTSFSDTDIVSRWGGEEFLIIVKNGKKLNIAEKLEEAKNAIEKSNYAFNQNTFNITMTFGYTNIDKKITREQNLEKAYKALVYGKSNGKSCIHSYKDVASKK